VSEPLFPPPSYPPPVLPPPGFPPPRKRSAVPIVLAVLAAVLVLAVAIVIPVVLARNDDAEADGDARTAEPDATSLDAVKEYPGLTNQHLAPGEELDYPQSPPVGGDHAPYWLECGAYDEPVPEANAVHDLEHGTVWLTYRTGDVDAAGVQQLAEVLPANGILSPYDDQEAPVVITVWGRQLGLTGPDDPRIARFIARFGAGDTAPEPFASCNGGVDPADLPPVGGPVV
jgi:hypothetical protein